MGKVAIQIGKRVRALREGKAPHRRRGQGRKGHMTIAELATATGLSPATVNKIELGYKVCAGGREMSGLIVDRSPDDPEWFGGRSVWYMDIRLDSGEVLYLVSWGNWWFRLSEGGRPIRQPKRVEVYRSTDQHLA